MNALTRMKQANPIQHVDQILQEEGAIDDFLLQVQERSGLAEPMPTVQVNQPTHPTRSRFPGYLIASASAVATLLLFGFSLVNWGTSSNGDAAAPGTAPVEVVASAYTALNSGDVDQWMSHFTADADVFGFTRDESTDLYAVLAAIGYQATITEPCKEIEPIDIQEARVACTVIESDNFHGAAGLTLTREEIFTLTGEGSIRMATARLLEFTQPGYYVFNRAFFDWLRDAHPVVHSEIRPEIATHLPMEPESMRIALDYLDEFLAKSESFSKVPVTGR